MVPPAFASDAAIRCFAAWTCGGSPTILTVLQPRDFVDWSIVIFVPVSVSISLAKPPPLPKSQPTHCCSTCRSSSPTVGGRSAACATAAACSAAAWAAACACAA